MDELELRSLTPGFPPYSSVRHFIQVADGTSYSLYRNTYNAIWEQRGNPQEIVEWADPDDWIQNRLSGQEREFAFHIWQSSNKELNPRYLRGVWYLAIRHELLIRDQSDVLRITPRGKEFLANLEGEIIAEVDAYEGVLNILQIVAERGTGKRSDFLEEYSNFCQTFTSYRSETVIKGSLYDRLVNLVERGFVNRNGQIYDVSDAGLANLDKFISLVAGRTATKGKQSDLIRLTKDINKEARALLSDYLSTMNPFKFEELIKFLLEEMGYTDVETTSPTNDKGVDVVAKIQLGISSVVEVVQAKRYNHNVRRNVLDELRGSLHRFEAVRATIITTAGFAKGTEQAAFERGAAPITLIDGQKLVDLLIEYGIGITKKSIEYFEFDPSKLAQFDTKEAVEPAD